MLTVFAVGGCGGGGGSDCSVYSDTCPPEATISSFRVSGNATPVNGREQIVAAINTGTFTMSLNTPTDSSGNASIWISDGEDLASTNLEQKLADIICTYYPFCSFNMTMNCNFNITNLVNCTLASGGGSLINTSFPIADITSLMGGNQSDLFIVVNTKGNGTTTAQNSVPVTFRYN